MISLFFIDIKFVDVPVISTIRELVIFKLLFILKAVNLISSSGDKIFKSKLRFDFIVDIISSLLLRSLKKLFVIVNISFVPDASQRDL